VKRRSAREESMLNSFSDAPVREPRRGYVERLVDRLADSLEAPLSPQEKERLRRHRMTADEWDALMEGSRR
jgi:hypothetical protein